MTATDNAAAQCAQPWPLDPALTCFRDPGHDGQHAVDPGGERQTRVWADDGQTQKAADRYRAACQRHSERHARIMANLANPAGIDWDLYDRLKAEQDADWEILDSAARLLRFIGRVTA